MKVLLTGRTGQLGRALEPVLWDFAVVTPTSRSDLDLSDETAIREFVRTIRPDVIVNTAAFTAVDLAEAQSDVARAVNTDAPRILAEEAQRVGAGIVHFSTDYVFDGQKDGQYTERDATLPLNTYGRTKLDGEAAVRVACPAHLVFRLSWVYDVSGTNFFTTMERLLLEREQVSVVDDQVGSPTFAGFVAEAVAPLVAAADRSRSGTADWLRRNGGTFHMTGPGSTSWYGFACVIRDALIRSGRATARVVPVPTTAFPRPARRPVNSRLSSDLLRRRLGVELPHWERQLDACLAARLTAAVPGA